VNKEEVENEIRIIKSELTKPEKEFQEYKESLRKWEKIKQIIIGNQQEPFQTPESLSFYMAEKDYIDNKLGSELKSKREELFRKVVAIFTKKKEIIELYKEFKQSIDSEIKKDKDFIKKFHMDIDVSFRLERGFIDHFLGFINKAKKGTFYGISEGKKYLERILESKDLLNEKDLRNILSTIISYLEIDQREGVSEQDKEREIPDQIETHEDFYKFIFLLDYLIPKYELKLDNKSLEELSPGEKGALLLVFYLMIDIENIPLIIDQPEDNLDNKSVFQVLTHFMRFAKKRRQIIIVTHNPNLAVGADAEQIIYVNIDKKNRYEFSCRSGSIENPEINEKILDILEGTMPAFDKRRWKYRVSYDGKRK
jgi:hypothetical protein